MASFTLVSPQMIIARNAGALYDLTVGHTNMNNYGAFAGTNVDNFLNDVYANSVGASSTADVASTVVSNLGITDAAAITTAQNYIVGQLNAVSVNARGAVLNNILSLFATMTDDAVFGSFATNWNIRVANAVAYAEVPGNPDMEWDLNTSTTPTYTLTNGTDIVPASKNISVFNSDQVYTPNGNTRINSLQDEDNLTGTGTSTLNATLGNVADNGGIVITPKLAGISTINTAFTGSGATAIPSAGAALALDLQDATGVSVVNVSRVSGTSNQASVENIKAPLTDMGITDSNSNNTGGIEFSYGNGVLSGVNTGNLNLSNVQVGNVWIGQNNLAMGVNGLPVAGGGGQGVIATSYENLTINSTGQVNTIGTLTIPMDTDVTGKITITGDQNLTLGTVISVINAPTTESVTYGGGIVGANGRLATLDASGMTGTAALTLNLSGGAALGLGTTGFFTTGKADTSGVLQNVSVIGSPNNDTFYLGDTVQTGDSLTGGAGQDKLIIYNTGNLVTAGTTGSSSITAIEALEVRQWAAGTSTVAVDKLPDVTTILVRNEGAVPGTLAVPGAPAAATDIFTLTGMNTTQANAVTVQHSDTGSNNLAQNTINATLATNTATDAYTLTIAEGLNTDPRFNVNYNPTSAENVTIRDTDTESNTVNLGAAATLAGITTSITLTGAVGATTGGLAGTFLSLDAGARTVPAVGATWDQRGGYNLDVTGAANDKAAGAAGTIAAGNVDSAVNTAGSLTANARYNTLDNGSAADVRIIAQSLTATTEASDVIARFGDVTRADGVSSQSVTGGTGNDSFIFDALGVKNSGYTSGDTVTGGTGLDTLVLDGNTAATQANGTAGVGGNVSTQKSEWDNTKGIDVLRLAGNQGYVNGTSNGTGKAAAADVITNTAKLTGIIGSSDKNGGYYTEIDSDFVKQTDAGNNLKIISNDGDLSTNLESDLVLNLRPLAQTANVGFVGANSNTTVTTLPSATAALAASITPAVTAALTAAATVAGATAATAAAAVTAATTAANIAAAASASAGDAASANINAFLIATVAAAANTTPAIAAAVVNAAGLAPVLAATAATAVATGINASNRIQLEDNSANGSNALDGGDTVVNGSEATALGGSLSSGNNNVLEVFNSADVSINDLSQTKNFGRIEGTNDLAVAQTLKLVLNDTVMDQLVDAGTAARVAAPGVSANIERLNVVANNNGNIANAVENLTIDASAVSNKFGLDISVARNAINNITGSLGADKVLILGNYNAADATAGGYAAVANDQFTGANVLTGAKIAALTNLTSVAGVNPGSYWGVDNLPATADDVLLKDTSIYNLGTGDTIEVFGGVDLTGATIAAGTTLIAHSTVRLTDAQVNGLAGIRFVGASAHELQVIDDGSTSTTASLINAGAINKLSIQDTGATLVIASAPTTLVSGLTSITIPTGSTVTAYSGATLTDLGVNSLGTLTTGDTTTSTTVITTPGTGGTTASTVTISAANTTANDATVGNVTYSIPAIGSSFTYSINGFAAGDKIAFPTGTVEAITNTSGTDGNITLTGTSGANTLTIQLTGVASATDGAIFNPTTFNTAFGAGTLTP